MAIRRRAAEHTVRYACLIQVFINALRVLKSMDDGTLKSCDGAIGEGFEKEAISKVILITIRANSAVFSSKIFVLDTALVRSNC